ncbi:carbohydrate-binding module family 50 protein [Apiospora sp. TS-2023a]
MPALELVCHVADLGVGPQHLGAQVNDTRQGEGGDDVAAGLVGAKHAARVARAPNTNVRGTRHAGACSGPAVERGSCDLVADRTFLWIGWTTTDGPANVPTFTGSYTLTTLPEVDRTFPAEPTQTGIVNGCLSHY